MIDCEESSFQIHCNTKDSDSKVSTHFFIGKGDGKPKVYYNINRFLAGKHRRVDGESPKTGPPLSPPRHTPEIFILPRKERAHGRTRSAAAREAIFLLSQAASPRHARQRHLRRRDPLQPDRGGLGFGRPPSDQTARLVATFLLQTASGGLSHYLMAYIGEGFVRNIREHLWNHILGLPIPYFDKHQSGETMSRI